MEMTFADVMLRLRFISYPFLAICGFLLGTVALGRLVRLQQERRRLYRSLTSIGFGLSWIGLWGVFGIVQYGVVVTTLEPFLPFPVISVAFSSGIVWLAFWATALTIQVVHEEWQMSQTVRSHDHAR